MSTPVLGLVLALLPAAHAALAQAPEPPLPDVTLPAPDGDAPPAAPQPPPPEEAGPPILEPIGPGGQPGLPEADPGPVPPDVPFVVPGDIRVDQGVTMMPPTVSPPAPPDADASESPPPTPPLVSLGVAVGPGLQFVGLEQAFVHLLEVLEFHIPELDAIRVGVGAGQWLGETVVVAFGPRAGLGATFCQAGNLRCEGILMVQPGVAFGGGLGTQFDLYLSMDIRFWLDELIAIGVIGGVSRISNISLAHASGVAGLAF